MSNYGEVRVVSALIGSFVLVSSTQEENNVIFIEKIRRRKNLSFREYLSQI